MADFDELAPWWRRRRTVIVFCLLVAVVWAWALRPAPQYWAPGQHIGIEPEQMESERDPWTMDDGTVVQPLAEYRLEARVLGRKDYSDAGAFASPMDLALGWGPMSRQDVIDGLSLRQSGRWYHYSWKRDPPVPVGDIIANSANTHLIPANGRVASQIEQIEEGDRVRLVGVLVALRRKDGWRWRSSLTRKDSGDGSCELMWVEKVEKLNISSLPVDARSARR